ncbi:hypothetical protein GBAR_LOCUS14752 [Geodia barretti]|nr:hypothetical protein GBAR_LOCUS14752 [Geodia barretti]
MASPVSAPATSPPTTGPSPGVGFPGLPAEVRHQTLRSHVAEMAAQGNDDVTISKITEELLKLSVEEQASLVARPDVLRHRVREVESILRRPGPTAALLNATTVPNPILGQGVVPPVTPMTPALYPMAVVAHKYAPDLPPFLTSIIDGLTNYMKWCDMHLQNPQNNRPGLKENLSRQRANLGRQSELVNQQITMYRELLQIVRSTTSVGVENPGIRAPHVLSATQPPFIPGRPPPVFAQPPIHPAIHQQQLAQQQQQQQQLAQQQQQRQVYQGASGPGGQVRPGLVDPGRHTHFTSPAASASAFAYGMTSYFPKAEPGKEQPVTVQTNLPPSQSKRLSPLEAAINDVSSRSSPVPRPPEAGNDLYLSDDEFNS